MLSTEAGGDAANNGAGLLAAILVDPSTGAVRPARLAALLQAALGYVAESGKAEGFIDFDAVPEEGAAPSEVLSFLLSPGAAPISTPYSVAPADEHGDVFVHGLEHIYTVLQEHL